MWDKLRYHLGIGLFFLFSSCITENKQQQGIAASETNASPIQDTLTYHMEVFKETSPYLSATEKKLDTTFYAARYPAFSAEIDSLFRDAIFVDGEHTAQQVSESFLGGFNEYAEEQIESGSHAFHAWFMNQDCEVVLNVPGFLSLKNTISDYTGGAHGMEVVLWTNYDIQGKRKLLLTDLVRDMEALRQIAESRFRKQEKLSDTSSYGGSYFFDNDAFSLADNFGLTADGLLFHYNPYEIKSYAEGPTTLVIPYNALGDIMTEKSKRLLEVMSGEL